MANYDSEDEMGSLVLELSSDEEEDQEEHLTINNVSLTENIDEENHSSGSEDESSGCEDESHSSGCEEVANKLSLLLKRNRESKVTSIKHPEVEITHNRKMRSVNGRNFTVKSVGEDGGSSGSKVALRKPLQYSNRCTQSMEIDSIKAKRKRKFINKESSLGTNSPDENSDGPQRKVLRKKTTKQLVVKEVVKKVRTANQTNCHMKEVTSQRRRVRPRTTIETNGDTNKCGVCGKVFIGQNSIKMRLERHLATHSNQIGRAHV